MLYHSLFTLPQALHSALFDHAYRAIYALPARGLLCVYIYQVQEQFDTILKYYSEILVSGMVHAFQ